MTAALIGMEVVGLGDYGMPPHRLTLDFFEDGQMKRLQIISKAYRIEERKVSDLLETPEVAAEFDRLDREAAAKILPIMEQLFRDQVKVKYGDEGLALLDDKP
jgi:hypothetical protein